MKKLVYFASLLAVVAGCTKEVTPIEKPTTGTYTLLAEFAQGTKSTINDETGAMTWSVNDHISVLSDDGEINADFTLSGGQPTNMGVFTGDFEGTPVFAVYPFNEDNIAVDDQVDIYLPCEYEYNGEETHAPMLASIETTDELTTGTAKFKHVAGLIKVTYENVPLSAKHFEFTATKQITGTFSVDSEGKISATTGDDRKSVSYDINNTEEYTDMVFYVPVPCGVYGFNVALLDENMDTIANTGRKVSNTTISVGQYYIAPTITLKKPVWVENFNNTTVTDTKVGNGARFETQGNTDGHDYAWTSTGSVYVFHDGIRLGNGSAVGSVKNETIIPEISSETFTVKVYAAVWNTDGGKITVKYGDKTQTKNAANNAITDPTKTDYSSADFAEATEFIFEKVEEINEIEIASSLKRIIVDKVVVVEGGEIKEEDKTYSITIAENIEHGSVSADPSSEIKAGTVVTLTATPDTGYEFDSWNVTGATVANSTNATTTFTMPATNVTVSATFKAATISDKTIAEFIASKGGNCYLTGVVSNIANTTYGNFDLTDESGKIYIYGCLTPEGEAQKFSTLGVEFGDKIKVIASEYEVFNSKDEAKNVVFVEIVKKATKYDVNVADGITNGTVTVNPTQAAEGQIVTITATPASGYKVKSVSAKKTASGDALEMTGNKFTMPAEAVTVSAEFEESLGETWTTATMAAGTNGSSATVNEHDAIKVGTSSKGGDMTIKVAAGSTKVRFYAAAWNGVTGLSLNITPQANVNTASVNLTADTGIAGNSPFTLSTEDESSFLFEIDLKDVTTETTLKLASSSAKRFVVWGAEYCK